MSSLQDWTVYFLKKWGFFFCKKKGQIAVEYVLLLLIAVSICLLFLEFFEVGDTDAEGSNLIQLYRSLVQFIARDLN